jgi:hypothetical protein
MGIVRSSSLLTVAFIAMTAVMALDASAAIQVQREDQGNAPCGVVRNEVGVISGGCNVHFSGEVALTGHVFGIEAAASDCNIELEARISEAGAGWFHHAAYTNHPEESDCTRTPCGLPWEFVVEEEGGPLGFESIHTEFCAHPSSGADNRCDIEALITDLSTHGYRIDLSDVPGTAHSGVDCELTSGRLDLETGFTNVDTPHHEIRIIH